MLNADSKQLEALLEAFTKAEQRVQTVLLNTDADTVQELKIELNKKLDKVSLSLFEQSKKWAKSDLPMAYNEGVQKINGHSDRKLHQSEDVIVNSYIELSTKVQTATDNAKNIINNAIRQAEKSGYGATVGNVKEIIKETLSKENSSMIVEYSNGAKMPLDAYAQMLARTSRIESSNTGSFDRCRRLNIDLVRCTTMPGCCAYCRMYEGKVYSISGNDKRFPSLYDTALKKGYNIMHPNCRHEFIPFVEQMQSETELKQLITESNNFQPPSKNDIVIKKYNQDQATLRQWRNELNEYNRLKAKLGNDMPYSTLGAFRRAKRGNSKTYQSLNSDQLAQTKRKPKGSYKIIKEPKAYVNKTNFHAIETELKSFIKKVDVSKITSLDNLNATTATLKRISQQYGIEVAELKTTGRGSANASATYNVIELNYNHFNKKQIPGIVIGEKAKRDLAFYEGLKETDPKLYLQNKRKIDNYINKLREQINFKRWTFASESGKIEETVIHECGHLVHNQLFGLGPNGYSFRRDPTKTAKELEIAEKRRWTWQFEVYSKLKSTKDIHNLSYYCLENERECFAECFVAYDTGRELPKYVENFFNDLFGGKRK